MKALRSQEEESGIDEGHGQTFYPSEHLLNIFYVCAGFQENR